MKKKKLNKPILAEGEVTRHFHALENGTVYEREDGLKEFALDKKTNLTHQEHNTVEIPNGEYVSDQVLETDHLADEIRRVVD